MKVCICELSGNLENSKAGFCEICNSDQDILSFYANFTKKVAVYPNSKNNTLEGLNYCVQKLTSEAGEVSGKVGKYINKNNVRASDFELLNFQYGDAPDLRKDVILELGDLLWYAFEVARQLNVSIEEVLITNVNKLNVREQRGTIIGDGDDR